MESRFRQAFLDRLVLIKDMPEILYSCGDDTTTACGADDKVKGAIDEVFNDGRRDGRQGPFSRLDEIGRRGRVAESVRLVGYGEVVHLIIHDDAGFGHYDLAAEKQVDGCG